MAKIVGLVGAVSGKVGNFVGAVVGGVQTMRVYQPIVANPRTALQTSQRNKVTIAGKLSKVITREAIVGLPGNARQRRAAMLSNLIKEANAAFARQSSIKGEKIIFSMGDVKRGFIPAAPIAGDAGTNTINVTLTLNADPEQEVVMNPYVRFIVLAIQKHDPSGQGTSHYGLAPVCYTEVVKTNMGETFTKSVLLSVDEDVQNYNVFAWAVPMDLSDKGREVSGELDSVLNGNTINMQGIEKTSGLFNYGNSVFLGASAVVSQ